MDPEHKDSYLLKRFNLQNLKLYEESIEVFNRSIELDHQDQKAWYGKASSLSSLGLYEEALEVFKKGLELEP